MFSRIRQAQQAKAERGFSKASAKAQKYGLDVSTALGVYPIVTADAGQRSNDYAGGIVAVYPDRILLAAKQMASPLAQRTIPMRSVASVDVAPSAMLCRVTFAGSGADISVTVDQITGPALAQTVQGALL